MLQIAILFVCTTPSFLPPFQPMKSVMYLVPSKRVYPQICLIMFNASFRRRVDWHWMKQGASSLIKEEKFSPWHKNSAAKIGILFLAEGFCDDR